jgi:hypothetical protein
MTLKANLIEESYSVVLDPKSRGETRTLCAIDITIPKKPVRRKIFGLDKKKPDQKWERLPMPETFYWDKPEEEYTDEEIEWVEEDFERRLSGIWFMNNGKPTYITGTHYYYLQWCQIDVGYPDFRERDMEFFYFWEACVLDDKCLGMIMVKHRREGATFKGAAMILEHITRNFRANGGMLSKTGADAKEFFYKLVQMFRALPKFYQPMISGTDNPKTVLEFDKPGERITKTTRRVQKSEALKSKIEWKNTAENSFDSYKLARFVCDEGGKWEEADVTQNWRKVRPTLSSRDLGKAFFPSTVNEMTKKGGKNFKKIWDQSDPNDRTGNDRTRSGLYRYFKPAYDGLEYETLIFIDEYGRSVIDTPKKPVRSINGDWLDIGAKEFLDNEREALRNDTEAYSEFVRQYPHTPEEAFRVEVGNCSFDPERLYQQREWNDEYAGKLITRGNFTWVGGEFGGDVEFVPSRLGRWSIAWVPEKEQQNARILKNGRVFPGNMDNTVSGADPYDHSTTTDGRKSDGASYTFRLYNPVTPGTYMFSSEYIHRPPTVFEFYEDMLKQSIFYGCQILCENNRIGLINWFTEKGFENYLMKRPEVTHTSSSKAQRTLGIPTSGEAVRDSLIGTIEAYVVECCGYNYETGEGGTVYFNKLVDDWLVFDANDWQKYDATVASGLTLLAARKIIKKPETQNLGMQMVRRYNNSGSRSVQINDPGKRGNAPVRIKD